NIEILFINREDYIKISSLGELLVDNRHLFLSKNIQKKFGGYAYSQIQKLKAKNSNGVGRQDLIEKFGYDTKFFMHSVRLLTGAIEILETCDFSTHRPNRKLLLDCRNGAYTFEEALEMIEELDNNLKKISKRTSLPDKPDYRKVSNLLIEINQKAASGGELK
ncbi:hypothetical protein ACUIJO_24705, partial [Klebsiella aerogenes]|uniref:hypothetical protein n=1 Tax=Klebsiella aerogenes TaxID=548 RepID=UPI00403D9079